MPNISRKPVDKMVRGTKPPAKGKPGMVYTGGSRDFDESTGKYRSGRVPVKPGRVTGSPVPPGKKLPPKPGRVPIPSSKKSVSSVKKATNAVARGGGLNRRGM